MNKFLYAHIYRKRLTFALALTIFGAFVYVSYQIVVFTQISDAEANYNDLNLYVMGIDPKLRYFYERNEDGIFQCIKSGELISYDKVNDDYCDCADGTDEPGTNACANGQFHCRYQGKFKNYPTRIASYKVNDRVCDCCDGSDEWKHLILLMENVGVTNNYRKCPRLCTKEIAVLL